MTFTTGVVHLIEQKTVTGAAVTDVTFTNQPVIEDRIYKLYVDIRNPTVSASDYLIFVNGDTTVTNYWSNAMVANGGVTNFARVNTPKIADGVPASPNGLFVGTVDIFSVDVVSFFRYNAFGSRGVATAVAFVNYTGQHSAPVFNIDSITIHSTIANAIDVGSIFRLYGTSTV